MNKKIVIYYLATVMKVEAVCLFLPFLCSLFYKEKEGLVYLGVSLITFLIATLLTYKKPEKTTYYRAESFLIVGFSWFILSLVGALPLYLTGDINNYYDSIFEVISGLTTTGASIIEDLDSISRCSIFWRSITQFIGGMGVLVLMLSILPTDGNNMMLMKAESPGPSVSRIKPHVRDTAVVLYKIYIVITIICMICYFLSGMSIFDAICYAFTTAGTGGFCTNNQGINAFSYTTKNLMTFFMLLYGVNFNVYYLILLGRAKEGLQSEEMKVYFMIVLGAVFLIVLNSIDKWTNLWQNIHIAFFSVASMITTTGYNEVPYCSFHGLSRYIFLFLMCIGSCAGSTAGGFKVSRFIILIKEAFKEINYQIHPEEVRHTKFEGKIVSDKVKKNTDAYLFIYVMIILISILIVSLQESLSFETVVFSVLDTFNNIGCGVSFEGKEYSFLLFNNLSKGVFMLLMLIGRLEIFPIVILFSKKAWNRKY